MPTLADIFEVAYGSKFDMNKMERVSPRDPSAVAFVGRSGANNGVAGYVAELPGSAPYTAGSITVSLGGARLLSAFVQPTRFYTAQNVAVLTARRKMSLGRRLFYCACIAHNRWRYSAFGREANRTLRLLEVPSHEAIPMWAHAEEIGAEYRASVREPIKFPPLSKWKPFRLGDLFDVQKGRRFIRKEQESGDTPFIGASTKHNGIVARVNTTAQFGGGCISVPYNGNGVAFAMYQPAAFCASDDIQALVPRASVSAAALVFVSVVLRRERFRYSYGRKWHLTRMSETIVRLPARKNQPDWEEMTRFIEGLPFSRAAFSAI